jgi:hypothetical protein
MSGLIMHFRKNSGLLRIWSWFVLVGVRIRGRNREISAYREDRI